MEIRYTTYVVEKPHPKSPRIRELLGNASKTKICVLKVVRQYCAEFSKTSTMHFMTALARRTLRPNSEVIGMMFGLTAPTGKITYELTEASRVDFKFL